MGNKHKHLEFIQLIITRMNINSFLIKGWVVTLMASVFAITTVNNNFLIPLLNYFIVPVFWILDGYYLSQERKYRALYDEVRIKNETEIDFDLNARKFSGKSYSWVSCIFSTPLVIQYGLLVLVSLGILFLIQHG